MGKCQVKDEWLSRKDPNGYLIKSWAKKAGKHELFCFICDTKLNVDHGFCRVVQHAQMKNHISNCKAKLAPLQLRLTGIAETSQDSALISHDLISKSRVAGDKKSLFVTFLNSKEKALKAELIWAMKCVLSNYSLHSNKDINELFSAMFGPCVPEDFHMSSSKMMYLITEALGPYFWQKTIDDAKGALYTICYDETTNECNQKELQIAVRYWSEAEFKVVQKHLETVFMGHATAEELHENLLLALTKANLPLQNILMVSCDGPNVNKKVIRLMNESLLEIRKMGLIDVGTCSLHKVHNAFQKGLEEMENDIPHLIISVFHYFDGWPARWEDYSNIQKKTNVPRHRFIKHVTSRWLTLGAAAERMLEQWDAVIKYFISYVPLHASLQMKSNQFQVISKLLKTAVIKAQLVFVIANANFFSTYSKLIQREEPMIHMLYEEGRDLLLKLRGKIYKPEYVSNFSVDEEKLLPITDMKFGEDLTKEVEVMKVRDSQAFLHSIQRYYVAACTYLKNQLNLNTSGNILSDLRCLQPGKFKLSSSEPQIVALGKAVPFQVDIYQLLDEWKILKFEDLSKVIETCPIDQYWSQFWKIRSALNEIKYPTVAKVVKAILSLSHGSASVERGFSASSNLLTSDKASMNARGLNARLNILSGLKRYENKPFLVPITKQLLSMGSNAHQSYRNYLQKEKENEQNKKKEAKEKGKLVAKAEAATKLKELSNSLVIKKSEEARKKKAADKLFDEATKRLESAVKRKNFEEISLAQGMLHGVKKLRFSEAEASKELSSIAKDIGKKSSVITSYLKKKTKE